MELLLCTRERDRHRHRDLVGNYWRYLPIKHKKILRYNMPKHGELVFFFSPIEFEAVVPAVGDDDVPVRRNGQALGTVQWAGQGVDERQEGAL